MRVGDLVDHPDHNGWQRIWTQLGCPALAAKISPGDVHLATDLLAAFASFRYLDWSDLETRRAVLRLTVVMLRQRCRTRVEMRLVDALERWETAPMMELSELAAKRHAQALAAGEMGKVRITRVIARAAILSLDAKVTPDDLAVFALTYVYDNRSNEAGQRAALLEVFPPLLTERWVNPWWERRPS